MNVPRTVSCEWVNMQVEYLMRIGSRESQYRKDKEREYGWYDRKKAADKSRLRTKVYTQPEIVEFCALRSIGLI